MGDEFTYAEPMGVTDEPDSPPYDELPTDDSAAMFEAQKVCVLNGQTYKNGDTVCGWNHRYQCRNGKWVKVGEGCP